MTCIVGIKTPQGVSIGGDSATTSESGLQTISASRKVFCIGDASNRMLLGCTTSCRMMQLLHYELQLPPYEEGTEVEAYLVTRFIHAVRDCLKAGGYAKKEDEREEGGNFLIGYQGRLFEVQDDYHVSEAVNGYEAVGSGATFALGSLYATPHLPAEQRITLALEAAASHNAYVRPPYYCLSLEGKTGEVRS